SEKELGISEEHEGIVILPDDAPTGAALADYLGDAVLEIAITPNYARALSILGVAREVAALLGKTVRLPADTLQATGPSVDGRIRVSVETPELCPRFSATLIEGITIGASPYWMQRRLTMAGMRPINNVVDVTNYVMLELGQPSHAFDADNVTDGHLIVRLAHAGEHLTTLDGKRRALSPEHLLVCDPNGPLSLAGVMGGATSEVSGTTTRLLLEAASWQPSTIRKTARVFGLPSEASRRFERGVDWELPTLMQRRGLALIQQLAGGTVAQGMIDIYPQPWQNVTLELTPGEVRRIIGISLTAQEIAGLLTPLGFGCTITGSTGVEAVTVQVPSSRQDVTILADLCEEVARMYGYDRIPATLIDDRLPQQRSNTPLELEQRVRSLLVGAGLDEAMTYSLTSMAAVARINPADAVAGAHLKLANPIAPEREYLRRSLLPVFLEAFAANGRDRERVLQFEIGRVYLPKEGQVLPEEPRRLAIALAGARTPLTWHQRDTAAMDFFDLKGVIEMLLARLNIAERVQFAPLNDDPRFQPGRVAMIVTRSDQQILGALGELHPTLRERLGIELGRAMVAELDLEALIALAEPSRYQAISRYPATVQDLAVVVAASVPATLVEATIRKYAGALLERATLFDVYSGPQVGEGKRSLAYRLSFRAADRTLSDADLTKTRQKIIRGLEHDAEAVIRG
ncbi:MAG: phenylalanine--tRNA ligase subunit beta, partial [Roseiflexaceae bacterium]|nr:phenylalanine--tRNA ligase subunit beta [Roseiflexaceae bacterium]